MKKFILEKLQKKIILHYLKIYNDTKLHKKTNNQKKHYTFVIVSKNFSNISLLNRHKLIYKIFRKYIPKNIYSLNLFTYTIEEWSKKKFIIKKNICLKKNI
ncbi:BolA family protein [Buchnera aphidicola]|uniref:BolA family protein n=1 Tax=Buchnera aphidicola TaxID=9 RepID=UPI0031B72143